MSDIAHMPPMRRPGQFRALMFACCAAPIFWLGQVMLGYWLSAQYCFGGIRPALIAFDLVATVAALAGLTVAFACRSGAREPRPRFMALWGIFSSLCFLAAILFNVIASIMVPLCAP
jgi:hypothetical protein